MNPSNPNTTPPYSSIVSLLRCITKWLKLFGNRNPVTGNPLNLDDLIPLKFHRNNEGAYHCPITLKEFTDSTHIVAVGVGDGNVYAWDAIKQLNIDVQNWCDLMNPSVRFTRKDLIQIQNPADPKFRLMEEFWYIRNKKEFVKSDSFTPSMNLSSLAGKVLSEMATTKFSTIHGPAKADTETPLSETPGDSKPEKMAVPTQISSGRMAASFTSTSLEVRTKTEVVDLSTQDSMYKRFCTEMMELRKKPSKGKVDMGHGYVQLKTNIGNLNLELNCVSVSMLNLYSLRSSSPTDASSSSRLQKHATISCNCATQDTTMA
jgi:peptidyl-prolyl cis-trans isomerase-like protein 2